MIIHVVQTKLGAKTEVSYITGKEYLCGKKQLAEIPAYSDSREYLGLYLKFIHEEKADSHRKYSLHEPSRRCTWDCEGCTAKKVNCRPLQTIKS